MVDPQVAGALILALGGVLLAVCGVLVVRQLRAPALDRFKLDGLERQLNAEAARIDGLAREAVKVATDARRFAASRKGKAEREEVERPEPETRAPARIVQPRFPIFKPGCDQWGNPVGLGPAEEPKPTSATDELAARGLRVSPDGKLEETG